MSPNQPTPEAAPPRRLRPIESFAIVFMVALGWTCSSNNGSSGSSGDDDDKAPPNFFGVTKSAEIAVDPRPAEEQ